jgi:hypothetical protein
MRAVAAAVSVSRSGLAAALARRTEERASSPPADDGADGELLGRIKAVLVENPAYGYRFVTAVLNDGVGAAERVNHKRVYRVMRDHHLLLARHTGRPTRLETIARKRGETAVALLSIRMILAPEVRRLVTSTGIPNLQAASGATEFGEQ